MCLCVCQQDNFRTSKHRVMKVGGWCTVQKSRASSNLGVIAPRGAHPKNVTFGYDVEKISAGCLVTPVKLLSLNILYTRFIKRNHVGLKWYCKACRGEQNGLTCNYYWRCNRVGRVISGNAVLFVRSKGLAMSLRTRYRLNLLSN